MAQFVADNLQRRFGEAIERVSDDFGDLTVWIDRARVHELLEHCKRDPELRFDFCMDVTAVDYLPLGGTPRFAVVYHLYSLGTGKRLRVKTGVPEDDPVVPTATDVWKSTDWFEREVYDMFGIRFEQHPNMKRILCHLDFVGHALRKDYPADLRWKNARPDDLIDEISPKEMERVRAKVRKRLSD
ncbi:MAG: NADH-quinone oxidoreductase subunit C [Gemmatimonadota bacterium]|jgi:NADH-quinone oxidoreductase subunit C